MIDLRATSGSPGTTLTALSTILAGNDGQSVAGVPVTPSGAPVLISWGVMSTIADTVAEAQMQSQDQLDPINATDFTFGASSTLGYHHVWDRLPYSSAARVVKLKQNTGANNAIGYTLDYYSGGNVQDLPKYGNASNWRGTTTYGGALTAITWKQQAFAPSPQIPAGTYAILGCWVNALTNYGLIRFRHADFSTFAPGYPVVDLTNPAVAQAVAIKDTLILEQGYQFVYISKLLGVASCPVFKSTAQGTGLNLEMAAITADTPQVTLNLAKVG